MFLKKLTLTIALSVLILGYGSASTLVSSNQVQPTTLIAYAPSKSDTTILTHLKKIITKLVQNNPSKKKLFITILSKRATTLQKSDPRKAYLFDQLVDHLTLGDTIEQNPPNTLTTTPKPPKPIVKEVPITKASTKLQTIRTDILKLVNKERKKAGLDALSTNNKLNIAAQKHAEYMATSKDFAHVTKNGSTPRARMAAEGYKYSMAAENIAVGQPSTTIVMQSRMNSPGHKKNILNASVNEIGIGYADGYRVQVFGKQL